MDGSNGTLFLRAPSFCSDTTACDAGAEDSKLFIEKVLHDESDEGSEFDRKIADFSEGI